MIELSVILPVYNVERYLERCLRTLIDQDMRREEYEIIVVNDGSPDDSREVALRLQQEVSNIRLIDQPNQGVSCARNRGIEAAQGTYLMFVDPDDYVASNLLGILCKRAVKEDLDILLCGGVQVDLAGEHRHRTDYHEQENKLFDGPAAFLEKDKPFLVLDICWGRLYRRELVHRYDIRFPPAVPHLQDGVFVRECFSVARKVSFMNVNLYYYCLRPGSTTQSEAPERRKTMDGYLIAAEQLRAFKNRWPLSGASLGIINASIVKYVVLPLYGSLRSRNLAWFVEYSKKIKQRGFSALDLENVEHAPSLRWGRSYNFSIWMLAAVILFDLVGVKWKTLKRKLSWRNWVRSEISSLSTTPS